MLNTLDEIISYIAEKQDLTKSEIKNDDEFLDFRDYVYNSYIDYCPRYYQFDIKGKSYIIITDDFDNNPILIGKDVKDASKFVYNHIKDWSGNSDYDWYELLASYDFSVEDEFEIITKKPDNDDDNIYCLWDGKSWACDLDGNIMYCTYDEALDYNESYNDKYLIVIRL